MECTVTPPLSLNHNSMSSSHLIHSWRPGTALDLNRFTTTRSIFEFMSDTTMRNLMRGPTILRDSTFNPSKRDLIFSVRPIFIHLLSTLQARYKNCGLPVGLMLTFYMIGAIISMRGTRPHGYVSQGGAGGWPQGCQGKQEDSPRTCFEGMGYATIEGSQERG